jgi:hypothetical protein
MFTGASASPVRLLRLLSALIPVTLPLTAGRLSLCRPKQAKKEIKKSFFLRSFEIRKGTYYLPRDFWPSSVNQKTISDFWDLNPGPNSLLAIVASLYHLPATSIKSHKYYKFQPTCRRAVLVAASLWRQLTQRCRL